MTEVDGYILRIATKKWVDQVFDNAIYYTNMRRKWKTGQTILFLHKSNLGDTLVGYGLVEKSANPEELPGQDKHECELGGWKEAIEFKYVKQFDKPVAIKDTFLRSSKLRGRYFHGLKLNGSQLEAILAQAEA